MEGKLCPYKVMLCQKEELKCEEPKCSECPVFLQWIEEKELVKYG